MSATPTFQPFNAHADFRIYVRNLPHWRQSGATYFVTFRQDGSIPEKVLAHWLEERQRWYRMHKLDPQWLESDPEHFATLYQSIPIETRRTFERDQARKLHEELDRCHGSCILRNPSPRQILHDSMLFFHGKRLWMGDFVLMPNHAHALVRPFDGWELEDLLGSVKKWTSRRIDWRLAQTPGRLHNKERFWQHESYDRIVRDFDELNVFRRYIARNAIAASLRCDEFTYYAAEWLDAFAPRPHPPV